MALKNNRRTFAFLAIIIVLSCIVMALGAFAVILFIQNPLGERMTLILRTPTTVPTVVSPAEVETTITPTPAQLPTDAVIPTSTPAQSSLPIISSGETCGRSGSVLLLFIGADFSGGSPPLGADAVRVVKADFDHKQITVVAFPRDLWLQTPGLASQNISATRLGQSFDDMKNATIGDPKHRVTAATTLVGQTLYDNFGLAPQTYLTVQMQNMPAMVDTIGGLEINNPQAFVSERNMYFPQGLQHLNGEQSKEFVRTFNPGGDVARRQRQNLFVQSLQDTMLSAGIITRLPGLAVQFNEAIVTDFTPEMISQLTCIVQEVPKSQVRFYEISGDLVTVQDIGQGQPVLMPKVEAIKARLTEWLGE